MQILIAWQAANLSPEDAERRWQAALGAWHIGLHGEALAHARAALAYSPEDKRLRKNVEFMEKASA